MTDLMFFVTYILPFVFLYFHRKNGWPHVVQINCTNFMVLNYIIAAHMGLIVLYFNPYGFAQLKSVDKNTVLLLSFYTNILVIMYVISENVIINNII